MYFRSLTGDGACRTNEVGFGQLATDLKSAATTPSLVYIVPSPCADGSEAPCKPHTTPGLAGANRFLKSVVPEIKHSPAYQDGGLIAITFDQAPQTGPDADSSACCGPSSYPNLRPAGDVAGGASSSDGTGHDDDHRDEQHHYRGEHDDDRRVDHDRAGSHEHNVDHRLHHEHDVDHRFDSDDRFDLDDDAG